MTVMRFVRLHGFLSVTQHGELVESICRLLCAQLLTYFRSTLKGASLAHDPTGGINMKPSRLLPGSFLAVAIITQFFLLTPAAARGQDKPEPPRIIRKSGGVLQASAI